MVVAFTEFTGKHTWLPRDDSPERRLLLAAKARAAHGKRDHKDGCKSGSDVKRVPSKVHRPHHFGRLASIVSHDSRDIVDLLTERMHTLKSLGSIDALTDEHIAHMKDRVQVADESIVQRVRAAKKSEILARQQLVQSYDQAAVSWTTTIWAALTIQRRWKGFVARRAFLRDRRMRWIQKRSESLRLHQDRRWKWMDTKDQVIQRYHNASAKARELEPDDSPPLQSDTQVVGSQHEQSLSPAWETLLAGIITVKTLQKTVQSRRPSTHTVEIHTVPLHMPAPPEPGQESYPAHMAATCPAPVPHTFATARLQANRTQPCQGMAACPTQPEDVFPSAAYGLAQEPAVGAVLGAGIDTSGPSLCPQSVALASAPMGPNPTHAVTTAASALARVQTPAANRTRSRQRQRFQRPPSPEAVRLNLQPSVLPRAVSPPPQVQAAAACATAGPRSRPRTPCGPLLHDSAILRVEKPVGACVGRSLQRGMPSLGATARPRTSSVVHTAQPRGRSPGHRRPQTRQKLGWVHAASTVPARTCHAMRRAVSAPAEQQCIAWQEDELEVTGQALSVGINLMGHVAGAGHASPSPVSRPRTHDSAVHKVENSEVVERVSPHHEVIPVSEATADSLLVVCDDEAAAGRSRSAHRTRKSENLHSGAVGEVPATAASNNQLYEQHVGDVVGQQSRAHVVEELKQLSRKALRGGLGQAEGSRSGKRSVSVGRTTDGRPVTAPGHIHTGRAPLTKVWASRELRDEGFAAAGAETRVNHQQALVPRVQYKEAAEGQFALQLNVQAASVFERVARQSSPVVLWGVGNRMVH